MGVVPHTSARPETSGDTLPPLHSFRARSLLFDGISPLPVWASVHRSLFPHPSFPRPRPTVYTLLPHPIIPENYRKQKKEKNTKRIAKGRRVVLFTESRTSVQSSERVIPEINRWGPVHTVSQRSLCPPTVWPLPVVLNKT